MKTICLVLLLTLSACGAGDYFAQGGTRLKEGAERGWSGWRHCQEERDKRQMGVAYDPSACPPVPSNPDGRV